MLGIDRTVIGKDDKVETVVESSLETFNQRCNQAVNVRQRLIHLTKHTVLQLDFVDCNDDTKKNYCYCNNNNNNNNNDYYYYYYYSRVVVVVAYQISKFNPCLTKLQLTKFGAFLRRSVVVIRLSSNGLNFDIFLVNSISILLKWCFY